MEAEAVHQVDQRLAILADLLDQPLEELGVLRAAVLRECPPGELDASGRARQVVVQIDPEQLVVKHRSSVATSSGRSTTAKSCAGWSRSGRTSRCGQRPGSPTNARPYGRSLRGSSWCASSWCGSSSCWTWSVARWCAGAWAERRFAAARRGSPPWRPGSRAAGSAS